MKQGAINLIYAFGDTSPVMGKDIIYHGANRGSQLVTLINPTMDKKKLANEYSYRKDRVRVIANKDYVTNDACP